MLRDLQKLWQHRELLMTLTRREIKVRYKQVFLGFGWAVLQPLILMLVFTIVFTTFARIPTEGVPYPVFAYVALLPWLFLSASLSFAIPSLVANSNLVTKVYFPREIVPMAAVGGCFFDFLAAFGVFGLMMLFYDLPLSSTMLFLPVLIVVQVVFALGLSLAGAALNVFYRDLRFILPIALQVWLFLSPVIYPLEAVPESLLGLFVLNPMAGIIDGFRAVLIHERWPDLSTFAPSALVAGIVLPVSYRLFKRRELDFSDVI